MLFQSKSLSRERDTGTGGGETSILQVGDKEGRIQHRAREAVLRHRTDPCPRAIKHKPPPRPGFRVLQTPMLSALQTLLGAGVLAGAPQEEPPGWPLARQSLRSPRGTPPSATPWTVLPETDPLWVWGYPSAITSRPNHSAPPCSERPLRRVSGGREGGPEGECKRGRKQAWSCGVQGGDAGQGERERGRAAHTRESRSSGKAAGQGGSEQRGVLRHGSPEIWGPQRWGTEAQKDGPPKGWRPKAQKDQDLR